MYCWPRISGAAPQTNVAVQGQTGAQPEGAFLNLVNWIGNVIAPVGAALAIAGGLIAYIAGRGAMRYVVTLWDVLRCPALRDCSNSGSTKAAAVFRREQRDDQMYR